MIGKDKTRILLTLPKDFKEIITKEAESENRSISNYMLTILLNRKK